MVEVTKIAAANAARPKWRTPTLSEDAIVDVTLNMTNRAGDDGLDRFPGYETTGNS